MSELFSGLEGLPNIHPLIVHFPIVLLVLAPTLDFAGFLVPSRYRFGITLQWTAIILFCFGAVASAAAIWTGSDAAASVVPPRAAEMLLAGHEDWAWRTLWFSAIYAAVRLTFQLKGWTSGSRPLRGLLLLVGLSVGFVVSVTADHGGRLVYMHGVGVRSIGEDGESSPDEGAALTRAPDAGTPGPEITEGSIVWRFQPGDEALLRDVFEVALGSWKDVTATTDTTVDGLPRLILNKSGSKPLLLLFASLFADVEMEVEMDPAAFDGKFGLVRHVAGEGHDALMLDSAQVSLQRVRGDKVEILATSGLETPVGSGSVRFVMTRRHQRGYVGNRMVVHGHASEMPSGQVGLLLEGEGTLRVRSIAVRTLATPD
jgi:uncharacterized membrane protein